MTKNWADMGTYGRYIRRGCNILATEIKNAETDKKTAIEQGQRYTIPDIERMVNVVNSLVRAAQVQAKLADVDDHDKRLADIEALLKKIPKQVLAQAKTKYGN